MYINFLNNIMILQPAMLIQNLNNSAQNIAPLVLIDTPWGSYSLILLFYIKPNTQYNKQFPLTVGKINNFLPQNSQNTFFSYLCRPNLFCTSVLWYQKVLDFTHFGKSLGLFCGKKLFILPTVYTIQHHTIYMTIMNKIYYKRDHSLTLFDVTRCYPSSLYNKKTRCSTRMTKFLPKGHLV